MDIFLVTTCLSGQKFFDRWMSVISIIIEKQPSASTNCSFPWTCHRSSERGFCWAEYVQEDGLQFTHRMGCYGMGSWIDLE